MSAISNSASSSSFSCSSCMDTCVRSLPLKIVSCIPIIGIATTFLAGTYANYFIQQNTNAIEAIKNDPESEHEVLRLGRETIEWAKIPRDHSLASMIRQVANIVLIVLGITTGGAVKIGLNVGIGIGWFCLSRWINNEMEEISDTLTLLETKIQTQKDDA